MKWKNFFRRVLITITVIYVFVFVFINYIRPLEYYRCDLYTQRMNGGIHSFQGKNYKIELCGLNGFIEPENFPHDEVRLRVYSLEGELLVERYFPPLLGLGAPIAPLKYGDDYLTYDTVDQSPSKKMAMPPTILERIRAKLPRMLP